VDVKQDAAMAMRNRKLIGTVLLLLFLGAYA
jgi:hypothetical protein